MPVTLEKVEITPDMAGCWLDGRWGWHNSYRVVDKAYDFGFTIPSDCMDAMRNYWESGWNGSFEASDEEWEAIHGQGGLSDQATDFLQERAPEGFVFIWDMGDLTLMSEDDAELF